MKQARTIRRNALAATLSILLHVGIVALIFSQASPDYQLPETPAPPMDVRIMPMEEPPPPPVIMPRSLPRPVPPEPRPPEPVPPKPAPPKPIPPTLAPARPQPAPTPPSPAPPAPAPARPAPVAPQAPRPLPAPTPRPLPTPVAAPPKATPAPPAPPKAAPATPAPPAPLSRLNIHKPVKDAPATVATAPFAPAAAAAGASGAPSQPPAGGEPNLGGSRLSGLLNPGLFGGMAGGGGGLRGTLVGCANADVVRLSAVERARCNDRLGTEAASAPALDTMTPAKRAAFDKAAANQEADRKYRASVPTGTTPGNHGFGGLGPDQPDSLRNQIRGGGP